MLKRLCSDFYYFRMIEPKLIHRMIVASNIGAIVLLFFLNHMC